MNILFLDVLPWDYDVTTPERRPLGGSQSATVLSRCGPGRARPSREHGHPHPRSAQIGEGVHPFRRSVVRARILAAPYDVCVVLNGPGDLLPNWPRRCIPAPRWCSGRSTPWTSRQCTSCDNPRVPAAVGPVVCVSSGTAHGQRFHYQVPAEKLTSCAMPSARVSRTFSPRPRNLSRQVASGPILAYTSTPFRGLDLLVSLFPQVRQEFPGSELQSFPA